MSKKIYLILHAAYITSILFSIISCNSLTEQIEFAGNNAMELQRVLDRYADSTLLKRRSADFIVKNIAGHYYHTSPAITKYTELATNADTLYSDTLRSWWSYLKKNNNAQKTFDARTINEEYICDNIEHAVNTWRNTLWSKEIGEEVFLNFVLPYRVKDEPPSCIGWRDSLYRRYHPLIEGVNDVKAAFGRIHKHILKEFPIHDIGDFPYILSATDASKMKTGRCINQSAYIVAVMRALGIPSALDVINNWANYSMQGHSWASLIINDTTYTVNRDDSVAKQYNDIDASIFHIKDTLERDYIHDTSFKKRISKIWRNTYSWAKSSLNYDDTNADEQARSIFKNPFITDVTSQYGYRYRITRKSLTSHQATYLCTYKTGKDWTPDTYSESMLHHYTFDGIPDSVIFLHSYFDTEHKIQALGNPFVITSKGIKEFTTDTIHLQTLRITRKYPFTLNSVKSWTQAVGAYFEGSDYHDFHISDTIFKFNRTATFRNEIYPPSHKKYRYIRYHSDIKKHAYISEIEIISNGRILPGKPFGKGVSNPRACFDRDTFSFPEDVEKNSWIALDLGKSVKIDRITMFPKNDGNNIIAGNTYELFCYVNGEWRLYGRKKSYGYEISFDNIPSNALYRIHCIDDGKEEQVFTYENGRQIWW